MMAAKLAVLMALALLGPVSCQSGASNGYGSGYGYSSSSSNGGASAVAGGGGGGGSGGGGGGGYGYGYSSGSGGAFASGGGGGGGWSSYKPTPPLISKPPTHHSMSPPPTHVPIYPPASPPPAPQSLVSPIPQIPSYPSPPPTPQTPTTPAISHPPTPTPQLPTNPPTTPPPNAELPTPPMMSPPPTPTPQPPARSPMNPPSTPIPQPPSSPPTISPSTPTPQSPSSPPTIPPPMPSPQPPTSYPTSTPPIASPANPPTSTPPMATPQPPSSPPIIPPPMPSPQQPTSSPTSTPPIATPASPPTSTPPIATPQPPSSPLNIPQPPASPPYIPQPPASPPMSPPAQGAGQLIVGYYKDKCGSYMDVEAIVMKHVSQADSGIKAGLIRLFFHDCFVRGCDGSVLLDPTSDNPLPEKLGIPNFPSLRGFEVIDAAKAELEAACPGTVSCADIVAFAARDASVFLSNGLLTFAMPAGRYDGNVSLASETLPNLPAPFAGAAQLAQNFASKGLDVADMVTLSGAHSIGRSHCSSFSDRPSDMDPTLAANLTAQCASANGTDDTVAQDYETPDELDNQYYRNVLDHTVLFVSDAALNATDTIGLVRSYADTPSMWQVRFGEAMVKMGSVEVKTAANGEIRTTCRFVNSRAS